MNEMSVRVVATRHGQYNQILREPGEVFDLLLYPDGTYKGLQILEPIRDKDGNRTGRNARRSVQAKDWLDRPVTTKDGKPVLEHEDFAEDLGNIAITEGPLAGESQHLGWMRKVPPNTPLALYPENTDFWGGHALPPPVGFRMVGEQSKRAARIIEHKGQRAAAIAPPPQVVQVIPATAPA